MYFRPCIDLHEGKVKQIVGSSLRDNKKPTTNFISQQSAAYFAELYAQDGLHGGHIIMLGPNNESAAHQALQAFPEGMQLGGGINADNAENWLNAGASHLIVTSYVFHNGEINWENLQRLVDLIGKERLVLDLSCGRVKDNYVVMTNRWQRPTKVSLSSDTLEMLAKFCCEFLIHATEIEGKKQGIDCELVNLLGQCSPIPTTYAGGVHSQIDIDRIEKVGLGKIDFTVGSALDLFGGKELYYSDLAKRYCQKI